MGYITPGSLLIVACFSKGHYHPLLMSEAHTSHLLVVAMAPCHVPSSLSAAMSHGITPMTPNLCTRHCALVHPTLCLELTWLLLHLYAMSKPTLMQQRAMTLHPWLIKPPRTRHCALYHHTHGWSSHLAQVIAPLYHHREGKLHHTTSCGPPYVVEPMLSVGDLTWGPLVWPCPCHLISS